MDRRKMAMVFAWAMAAMPVRAWAADPTLWTSSGFLALRALLSLAFVLGLLLLTLRVLRRLRFAGAGAGATTREHPIASRGRLDLGARREIRVIDVQGRLLVIGITDQKMELLAELSEDALSQPESTRETPVLEPMANAAAGVPGIGRFLQRLITSF